MTANRRRSVILNVEALEERQLLSASTIVDHGGFVQHTGTVEAIFYGPGWGSSEQDLEASIQGNLHGFIDPSSNGPNAYLATLKNARYGDFDLSLTGSTNTSALAQASLPGTVTTQDVENYLSYTLNHPYSATQQADRVATDSASRIYLVLVDPNDAVQDYNGAIVTGYHRTFNAVINGQQQDVNYVVVAVPGGAAHNQTLSSLLVNPQIDTVTANTSSELIDALTNPSGHGWYANDANGTEVGNDDVYAYVNNDLVVRPYNKSEVPMLPVLAAAPDTVTFLLDNNGTLWERSIPSFSSGLTKPIVVAIAHGVTQVSDQGIDDSGRAMVDYLVVNPVTKLDTAYEFHDGAAQPVLIYSPTPGAMSPLGTLQGSNVTAAKAGQGDSYILLSNGTVWSYNDLSGAVSLRATNVTALDAGTTTQGVNMVDVLYTNGEAWEVPDKGAKKWLKLSDVVQVSAGRQGRSAQVDANGTAWVFEARRGLTKIAMGVSALASGTDANGNYVVDLVFAQTYVLAELDYGTAADGKLKPNPVLRSAVHLPAGSTTPVATLAPGGNISKMRAGVIDMIFTDGAFEGTIDGMQQLLGTNIQRAV